MSSEQTIAVAMSGGVDSSTVAAMLRADGHNVIGLTMQLWNQRRLAGREGMPESVQGRCCSLDDVYDARRVAQQIGIPYYVVNHEERFERDVVRPFVEEYLSGRTPDPLQSLQQSLEVRSATHRGPADWRRACCDRPLCPSKLRRGPRPLAAQAPRRSQQGSNLLSLRL